MPLIVEDGTGLSTAESYLSVADFRTRAAALALWKVVDSAAAADWITPAADADVEAALRRATAALDGAYGDRWAGQKTSWQQALDWPRSGVLLGLDADSYEPAIMYSPLRQGRRSYQYGPVRTAVGRGYTGLAVPLGQYLADDAVPAQVLTALTHLAARELRSPGALAPYAEGAAVVSETVGPVSVTYADRGGGRAAPPDVPAVDHALRPLLRGGGGVAQPLGRA